MLDYTPNLTSFEQDSTVRVGADAKLKELLRKSPTEQKSILDDKDASREYFHILFEVLSSVHGDTSLVQWTLLYLDGALEENRSRVDLLVAIQKSSNMDKHMDLVSILLNFLIRKGPADKNQSDLAGRILAMLLESLGFEQCETAASDFHNHLQGNSGNFSPNAWSFIVMYVCKINELASEFYEMGGVSKITELLEGEG
jgi:hypothetical protein